MPTSHLLSYGYKRKDCFPDHLRPRPHDSASSKPNSIRGNRVARPTSRKRGCLEYATQSAGRHSCGFQVVLRSLSDAEPPSESLCPMLGVPLAFGGVHAVAAFSASIRHRSSSLNCDYPIEWPILRAKHGFSVMCRSLDLFLPYRVIRFDQLKVLQQPGVEGMAADRGAVADHHQLAADAG